MFNTNEMDFHIFIKRWTESGARIKFEEFVHQYLFIQTKYNNALKKIRLNPGDFGIDSILADFDKDIVIWQSKFFINGIGKSQEKEIRDSYNTAIENAKKRHFKIYKWILVIPIDFDGNELIWWKNWKKKMEMRDKIIIESIDYSNFITGCMKNEFQDLYNYYFLEKLNDPPLPVFVDKIPEEAIFLKNIQHSDISISKQQLKEWFFYGDFLEQDLLFKNSLQELSQLNTIYSELKSIWQINHNDIYSKRLDEDGNDLFTAISQQSITQLTNFKNRISLLNISYILGLILKLSDRNEIYWSRNKIDYNGLII